LECGYHPKNGQGKREKSASFHSVGAPVVVGAEVGLMVGVAVVGGAVGVAVVGDIVGLIVVGDVVGAAVVVVVVVV